MELKTAKTVAIMLKVFIFLVGSLFYGLLREFKIGVLWVVIIMWGVLWALFYKWENLWVKK